MFLEVILMFIQNVFDNWITNLCMWKSIYSKSLSNSTEMLCLSFVILVPKISLFPKYSSKNMAPRCPVNWCV